MPPRPSSNSICRFCAARPLGLCMVTKSDDELASLQKLQYRIRAFNRGELIYGPLEPHAAVYNIVSGWVAVSHDLVDGQSPISQFLTVGALFGTHPDGLLSNGQSAIAMDDVTVCVMPAANLTDLLNHHAPLSRRLSWMISRDSMITTNRLAFVGQTSALTRIANLLMELTVMTTHQSDHAPGTRIYLPLTQAQIADATGLTAIHVNRMLRRLREDRVVDFHDGTLTLINPVALKTLAQLEEEISAAWTMDDFKTKS